MHVWERKPLDMCTYKCVFCLYDVCKVCEHMGASDYYCIRESNDVCFHFSHCVFIYLLVHLYVSMCVVCLSLLFSVFLCLKKGIRVCTQVNECVCVYIFN